MLYDDVHVFINGESFLASGRDATLIRLLADHHALSAAQVARLSVDALDLVADWQQSGWLHADTGANN
jgi:50S ribosomal protein L16 3-hydroxylase